MIRLGKFALCAQHGVIFTTEADSRRTPARLGNHRPADRRRSLSRSPRAVYGAYPEAGKRGPEPVEDERVERERETKEFSALSPKLPSLAWCGQRSCRPTFHISPSPRGTTYPTASFYGFRMRSTPLGRQDRRCRITSHAHSHHSRWSGIRSHGRQRRLPLGEWSVQGAIGLGRDSQNRKAHHGLI